MTRETSHRLVEKPLGEVLAAFAAPSPTPAGGAACALASAVGASLLSMVACLPTTGSGSDDDRATLSAATLALTGVRHRLADAIDADATAFAEVIAARRFLKASGGETGARTVAAEQAIRAATDVPLEVMRLSAAALQQAQAVAGRCHRAASSDVGVAIELLRAGFRGARSTVRSNLAGIGDAAFVGTVTAEVERLSADAARAATLAEQALATARARLTAPASTAPP
jgi:formiminotetrahydrofolate cyclodeaminase